MANEEIIVDLIYFFAVAVIINKGIRTGSFSLYLGS